MTSSGVALALVACCGVAAAEPCPAIAHEQQRADHWNLTWGLLLTSATIVQGAAALTPPLPRDVRVGAAIGAGKSFIGAAGRWILPLRVEDRPGCDVAHAASVERQNFWLLHIGNFVVNAGGAVAETEWTDWQHAAAAFGLGYAIGLVQIYTMPRHAGEQVSAALAPTAGGWVLTLGGAF
ncbi:MAG: hypothetical protein JO257_21795 [Deltaproteobacteria bacterium]|nr:hypothetical protein [Deltaproteobacteria bacterium]